VWLIVHVSIIIQIFIISYVSSLFFLLIFVDTFYSLAVYLAYSFVTCCWVHGLVEVICDFYLHWLLLCSWCELKPVVSCDVMLVVALVISLLHIMMVSDDSVYTALSFQHHSTHAGTLWLTCASFVVCVGYFSGTFICIEFWLPEHWY